MFDGDDRVKLASLMDHAPGQRQFARLEAYELYYMGKLKMSEQEFRAFCEKRMAESARYSAPNRKAIAAACADRGIILASHDDATLDHVDEAREQGVRVAEFPTTADPHILAERLGRRARESSDEVLARMSRVSGDRQHLADAVEIANNGTAEEAGLALVEVIRKALARAAISWAV